jgi:hypothetical protein
MMASLTWKEKLHEAKKHIELHQQLEIEPLEDELTELRGDDSQKHADRIQELQAEIGRKTEERSFQVTGKQEGPEIVNEEAYHKLRGANIDRGRGRLIQWAPDGQKIARAARVCRKKNLQAPAAALGALATISRDINRFEMDGYGDAKRSLQKGEVVMPVGEVYFRGDKKVVDVMAGADIFKCVPIATLRPAEGE